MGEAAQQRRVGGPEVTSAQLRRLLSRSGGRAPTAAATANALKWPA
ncbi:hypothetical protein OG403_28760 [Kitasatospora sp. NBC_01266]